MGDMVQMRKFVVYKERAVQEQPDVGIYYFQEMIGDVECTRMSGRTIQELIANCGGIRSPGIGHFNQLTTLPAPKIQDTGNRVGYIHQPVSIEELIEVWNGTRPLAR